MVGAQVTVSDELLVKKTKNGDYSSYEELVRRYEKKIYNIAYRFLGNQSDASDVLQETFLQALRKISGFKGNSLFSTWIYRIAVNLCLMKKRKEKVMRTVSFDTPVLTHNEEELKRDFPEDWSKSPAASLDNKELKETLDNAIGMLPRDYRSVFILRDMNNLSNEEAARVLKISLAAVKSRLHRARMFLRNEVSRYFQGRQI
jgi:RNA polymerase sigma-70 factor, ECF subfamily